MIKERRKLKTSGPFSGSDVPGCYILQQTLHVRNNIIVCLNAFRPVH